MINSNKKKKQFEFDDEKLKGIKLDILTYKNEDFSSLSMIKNKDLVPGQYEGGVKLWECSLDLCNFLPAYVGWYDLSTLKVLDLGCGHGIPGLYFLLRGAKVIFQDFNAEVLDKITKTYINQIYEKYNIDLSNNAGFLSGDWRDFNSKIEAGDFECKSEETKKLLSSCKFDIIVSADTIYNLNNYDPFYSVIKEKMNNPGISFICSKKFYFGVGGGTSQFMDYVANKGDFTINVVKELNDGVSNIRQIIELKNR